ncbi:MAG TPA: OB-fold domain-containing protein [Candidatus Entotheonella sp.]
MAGISAFGAYVPWLRLSRQAIAQYWGGRGAPGEKAMANFDEDSITMGVAAGIDALGALARDTIDGVYFATTTAPYKEKQSAQVIATALDLRRDVYTADFTDTLRAGTIALKAALDAVGSKSMRHVLVVVADARPAVPKSADEQIFGDGAAALVISGTGLAAKALGNVSIQDEITDVWRTDNDAFPQQWEARFIISEGYLKVTHESVTTLLQRLKLSPGDFSKLALYGPDPRSHAGAAQGLGLDVKTQLQDGLFNTVGNTGAAFAPMLLVGALEEAKTGQKLLLVTYGNGADAFAFEVTNNIAKARKNMQRGLRKHLASKNTVQNYEIYTRFRQLLTSEGARRPPVGASASAAWRDRDAIFRLYGGTCTACGMVQYPPQRVCIRCQEKDQMVPIRLSDQPGTVFTFTRDFLNASIDPPSVMSIVDFKVGGRIFCEMTDRVPAAVTVNMPVEMTFRKINEAGGFHNYYWKCRPVR